jgi:hypothetical protein
VKIAKIKKILFLPFLLIMLSFSTSVYAYVVLVVHQQGYTYDEDGAAPSLSAATGTSFDLYVSIATDESIEFVGLDSSYSFSALALALADESTPVDESVVDASISWTGFISTNSGSNGSGTVTYQKTMSLGESMTLGAGQYALGKIVFTSLTSGETAFTPDSASELIGASMSADLFTGFQGCTINPSGGGGTSSKNCFIATAAFGSTGAKEVRVLREFRDRYLLDRRWGRAFTRFYYRHSPLLAEKIAGNERLKQATRMALKPLVRFCEFLIR